MFKTFSPALILWIVIGGAAMASPEMTERAKKFVADHEKRIRPLDVAAGQAWWNANVSGNDADFKRKEEAQNKIDEALANRETFAELKALKAESEKGEIDDKIAARAIEVLYLLYLEKQVDADLLKKITAKANAVEQKFNVYRANVDGKEMADSEVRKILKTSDDSSRRKTVWEASKAVGLETGPILKDLVKLRNEMAAQLGFKNFHALSLFLNEQEGGELIKLFDDLDELTREPFIAAKKEIDERLSAEIWHQAGRVDAVALSRPLLSGIACRF